MVIIIIIMIILLRMIIHPLVVLHMVVEEVVVEAEVVLLLPGIEEEGEMMVLQEFLSWFGMSVLILPPMICIKPFLALEW